jgi:hypothetical protein
MKMLLLLGAMMTASLSAQNNQNGSTPGPGNLEVAVTWDFSAADVVGGNGFTMQGGGGVQLHGQFWRGLGAVADVGGLHSGNMHNSGVGLDLVTATFGPRYTWQPARRRCAVYAQFLVGEASGLHSVFPAAQGAAENADSIAWLAGGGMNISLRRHLALRILEADWLRTQMPNAAANVQNNLRLGAGLVFRFQ